MTITIRTRAYGDLSEIWNYIAANNPEAADRLEVQFFASVKLLGEHPGIGHARADVADQRFRFWGGPELSDRV